MATPSEARYFARALLCVYAGKTSRRGGRTYAKTAEVCIVQNASGVFLVETFRRQTKHFIPSLYGDATDQRPWACVSPPSFWNGVASVSDIFDTSHPYLLARHGSDANREAISRAWRDTGSALWWALHDFEDGISEKDLPRQEQLFDLP